jgi:hypothetical protein
LKNIDVAGGGKMLLKKVEERRRELNYLLTWQGK